MVAAILCFRGHIHSSSVCGTLHSVMLQPEGCTRSKADTNQRCALEFPGLQNQDKQTSTFYKPPTSGVLLSQQKRHYCSPLGHPSNHQAEAGCCYLKPPPHTPITPILGFPQEASQPGCHQAHVLHFGITFLDSVSLSGRKEVTLTGVTLWL